MYSAEAVRESLMRLCICLYVCVCIRVWACIRDPESPREKAREAAGGFQLFKNAFRGPKPAATRYVFEAFFGENLRRW